MSAAVWTGVVALGGVGAVSRVTLDGWIARAHRGVYPLGILVVNLIGSFLLGLITGIGTTDDWRRVLGTGFLGGFTTFSTWIVDSRRLADAQLRREAVWNIAVALVAGLVVAALGWAIGAWLGGSSRF